MSKTREVLMPIDDVNNLDDVVRLLGIGESFTTPAEAVQELFDEIEHLRAELEAARKRIPLSTLQREIAAIKDELNGLALMGCVPMWTSLIGRLDDLVIALEDEK